MPAKRRRLLGPEECHGQVITQLNDTAHTLSVSSDETTQPSDQHFPSACFQDQCPNSSAMPSRLLTLPSDLLQRVFNTLPLRDAERSSAACKILRTIASHHIGWQVIDTGSLSGEAGRSYLLRAVQATRRPHSLRWEANLADIFTFSDLLDGLDVTVLSRFEVEIRPGYPDVWKSGVDPAEKNWLRSVLNKLPFLEELCIFPRCFWISNPKACLFHKLRKLGMPMEPREADLLLAYLPLQELEIFSPMFANFRYYNLCSATLEVVDFSRAVGNLWIAHIDAPNLRRVVAPKRVDDCPPYFYHLGFVALSPGQAALIRTRYDPEISSFMPGTFTAAQGFRFAFLTHIKTVEAITFGSGGQPSKDCEWILKMV